MSREINNNKISFLIYNITCEWKGMNDLQPQFSQSSTVNDDEDDEEDVYDLNAS